MVRKGKFAHGWKGKNILCWGKVGKGDNVLKGMVKKGKNTHTGKEASEKREKRPCNWRGRQHHSNPEM